MAKRKIKKIILFSLAGFVIVIPIIYLTWAYIETREWYKEYQRERFSKEMESIPADNRSGDFCPNCKSTDVGEFFYGYYPSGINDSTDVAVEEGRLIPGGCMVNSNSSKYRCNSCSYEWGNYVDMIKRMKEKDEESN